MVMFAVLPVMGAVPAVRVPSVCAVHALDGNRRMREGHTLLPMTQELDSVVRERIRGLRRAKGWTLDSLAARCHLSPSTLSRIETGHRRVALDQLVPIARALDTTLDQLVEPVGDEDVVIRPVAGHCDGVTVWPLSRAKTPGGVHVTKMRIPPRPPGEIAELRVHPGREWFTVLAGVVELRLGDRIIHVPAGQAAEFATMTPHATSGYREHADILSIFDHDGERAHLRTSSEPGTAAAPAHPG